MKQYVLGASDDLIQLSGAVEEEIDNPLGKKVVVFFSDGTKARIHYENGLWNIQVLAEGPKFEKLVAAVGEDNQHTDPDAIAAQAHGRTDVLVMKEGITTVRVGARVYPRFTEESDREGGE